MPAKIEPKTGVNFVPSPDPTYLVMFNIEASSSKLVCRCLCELTTAPSAPSIIAITMQGNATGNLV